MPILENLKFATCLVCIGLIVTINSISLNEAYIKHPDQVVFRGEATTLQCHAENLEQPVNWWFRSSPSSDVIEICVNGKLLNGNANKFVLDPKTYSMRLKNATFADSGTYTCAENNGFDTRHATLLTVKEPECDHGTRYFVVGQQVTIQCNATTRDPVNWLFQRNPGDMEIEISVSGRLLNGNAKKFLLNDQNSDLTALNPSLTDAGKYTCVEDSGFGKRHSTQLVNVVPTPSESSTTMLAVQSDASGDGADKSKVFYVVIALLTVLIIALLIIVAFLLRLRARRCTRKSVAENQRQCDAESQASEPLMTDQQPEERKRRPLRFSTSKVPDGEPPIAVGSTFTRSQRASLLNSDATQTWPQWKRIGDFAQRFNEFFIQLTTIRIKKEPPRPSIRDIDFSRHAAGHEPLQ